MAMSLTVALSCCLPGSSNGIGVRCLMSRRMQSIGVREKYGTDKDFVHDAVAGSHIQDEKCSTYSPKLARLLRRIHTLIWITYRI